MSIAETDQSEYLLQLSDPFYVSPAEIHRRELKAKTLKRLESIIDDATLPAADHIRAAATIASLLKN